MNACHPPSFSIFLPTLSLPLSLFLLSKELTSRFYLTAVHTVNNIYLLLIYATLLRDV